MISLAAGLILPFALWFDSYKAKQRRKHWESLKCKWCGEKCSIKECTQCGGPNEN